MDRNSKNLRWNIIKYVFFTFVGYFIIGLPLAVLPIFIHNTLNFSTVIAGIVISLQYLTTFAVRGYAGTIVDTKGPKIAVLASMVTYMISGVLLFVAFYFKDFRYLSLAIIVSMRLVTGIAEGLVGASPINWAMLEVGNENTSTAISFNGVASYGGLALGAPLGFFMIDTLGWYAMAVFIFVFALIGLVVASKRKALKSVSSAQRISFFKVMKFVLPYGLGLALAGIGFGTISTFITLYYQYMHWENGAYCLSVFGIMFVAARFIFSKSINIHGGIKVTLACLITESIGLLLLWLAPNSFTAIVGAGITGLGFSLVFPALGVVAMGKVSDGNKGSALAAYGLFIDISLGVSGPLVGLVADHLGMSFIFPFALCFVIFAFVLTKYLQTKKKVARK